MMLIPSHLCQMDNHRILVMVGPASRRPRGGTRVALPDKPAPSTAIPSIRCTAHSRITGEPCGNFAKPGTVVCRLHGAGARQVRNAAGARVTLATLLKNDPRPVWEVVLDAVSTADALMTDLKLGITATADNPDAEPLDPGQLSRLSDAVKLAHSLASSAITVRAYELKSRVAELDGEVMANVIWGVMSALLRSLPGLDQDDLADVELWARRSLRTALGNVQAGARTPGDASTGIDRPPLAALRDAHVVIVTPADADDRSPVLALTAEPEPGPPTEPGPAAPVATEPVPIAPWPAGAWSPANPPPPIVFTTPEAL
jgi:hypothetical protein